MHSKLLELLCKADTAPSVGANLEQKLNNAITANIQRVADRQWRIRLGTHNVVFRDMADRVMKALHTVRELGTSLSSLDPVHAGLPWAGFSIFLGTIAAFPGQEEAAKSGVDKVAQLVTRYAAIESLYTNLDDSEISRSYDQVIVAFYTKIPGGYCLQL